MLKKLITLIVVLSTILHNYSRASDDCNLISSRYFQWLAPNGSLAILSNYTVNENDDDPICDEWEMIAKYDNCRFCRGSNILECNGSDNSRIPSVQDLPSRNLSLFKISQISSLPAASFAQLTIETLMIQHSNLSKISANAFRGVMAIKYLFVKYNNIGSLRKADYLFQGIQDLKIINLKLNDLSVLSSMNSANLSNLEYFSLAGNPIYDLNLSFLQNSGLQILNLRQVKFRVEHFNINKNGFSSLPNTLNTVDLSEAEISEENIDSMLEFFINKNLTTINLGHLNLKKIWSINPFVALSHISSTLKYVSLEATQIKRSLTLDLNERKTIMLKKFYRLEEVNMKNCGIQDLGDGELFQAFPNLKVISLSGNDIVQLNLRMFSSFHALQYLDLSNIKLLQVLNGSVSVAENLKVVDLSGSTIDLEEPEVSELFNTMPNIQDLSLCNAGITSANALQHMKSLKLLDLSGTISDFQDLYFSYRDLFTSNISLTELHFSRNNIESDSDYFSMFSTLPSLKILNLSNNNIRTLNKGMFGTRLETLMLSQNYINTWYFSITTDAKELKMLDLHNNQLTYINEPMIKDFTNLSYLNLDNNPVMCDSRVVEIACTTFANKSTTNYTGVHWQQNQCYDANENRFRSFNRPYDCSQYISEVTNDNENQANSPTSPPNPKNPKQNFIWVYFVIGATLCTAVIGSIVYVRWWKIRCYIHRCLSLRRARKLKKDGDALTRADVQYDVFVSYSDIDRSWVLDYLIPNMESDGDISLCFHERDFQVGLSILENIIECMDRSNAILLIVSSAFVRSKWCQFEMHLAQYRLIETYRDQLVLVLLEDIPRKARPQTLHHLMMTKTYIVWPLEPCKEEARELFWRRLKRALKPTYSIFDT